MVSDDSKIARGMMERTACEILLRVAPNAFPFALSQTACSSLRSRPKEMRDFDGGSVRRGRAG
jgi:hypothetical protein